MNIREVNPDRVRRYKARTTPDKIRIYVDKLQDNPTLAYEARLRQFAAAMRIKHPDRSRIDLIVDDQLARYPQETVVVAQVRRN